MNRGLLVSVLSVSAVACAVAIARGQAAPNAIQPRAVFRAQPILVVPAEASADSPPTDTTSTTSPAGTSTAFSANYNCTFRGGDFDESRLRFSGDESTRVLEEKGLLLKLPAQARKPPGFESRFRIGGDFQITVTYEIVSADTPAANKNVGAWISIETDTIPAVLPDGGYQLATFRNVLDSRNGYQFVTNQKKGSTGRTPTNSVQRSPSKDRAGKLQLVRSGGTLRFLAAEGKDGRLRELRKVDFSRDDIKSLSVFVDSTDPAATAEVRWIDLDVRAERLSGLGTRIVTIDNERITAEIAGTKDGKLLLSKAGEGSEAALPLDEIYSMEFDADDSLGVRWIGHEGRDVAQASAEAGGDGLADVHVVVDGLPANKELKQLILVLHGSGKSRTWRLDTKKSDDWNLVVERLPGAAGADVYFQPGADDWFEHQFALSATFADTTKSAATGRLAIHTGGDLKVGDDDAAAPPPQPTVLVHLTGGDHLYGHLTSLDDRFLTIKTTWADELPLPLIHLKAVQFMGPAAHGADDVFVGLLNEPPEDDLVLVRASDGSATQLSALIERMADGKLSVNYQGQVRSIRAERLVGWVFAQRPAFDRGARPFQVFEFAGGDALSGEFLGFAHGRPEIKTAWDEVLRIPQKALAGVRFHNGKLVYLSDLEPVEVEEAPYFDRLMPHRRDRALDGGPLVVDGTSYEKGLAVHSRCVLTYALDGQFATFSTVLGFDTRVTRAGRATCRVLGDGKELFAVEDFSATDPSQALELSIEGVRRLSLEVDFGPDEDIGDRVIWARARVMRASTD